jgi:hypothetical protein
LSHRVNVSRMAIQKIQSVQWFKKTSSIFLLFEMPCDSIYNVFSCLYENSYKCLQAIQHRLNMELDLQSLFGLPCAAVLISYKTQHPPPRIWAHIRGRYWSAEIDNIFLCPLLFRNPLQRPFISEFKCENNHGKPSLTPENAFRKPRMTEANSYVHYWGNKVNSGLGLRSNLAKGFPWYMYWSRLWSRHKVRYSQLRHRTIFYVFFGFGL